MEDPQKEIEQQAILLKEIDSNPVEEYQPLETDEDTNGTDLHTTAPSQKIYRVDLATRREIIRRWLQGNDPKEIGKDYGLSTRTVNLIIENNEKTRLDIEKRYFSVIASRENFKVAQVKDNIIDFVKDTLVDVHEGVVSPEIRLKFMGSVAGMLDKLDNISRLNQDKATSIAKTTNTNINIDVAEAMKQFKTPTEKLAFLQSQAAHLRNNNKKDAVPA